MSSPPTTLGKYQIIREIARSNDIVYEAYDPLMNRRVALKELAVPTGSTPVQKEERLKRFLREAKAAGSLAHPNIVTIYEVGEDGGRHYLVMEYLDGHTLRNELDAKGFLPPEESINVAEAVLRGLEYAHQNGVIHRDIKPENIQMLSDGRIKLTDFGIARLTFEPNLTMDGQVFGTPSYMSPEQVVGRDLDLRSDLFSVGVVLYESLAGRKPFSGDSVVAITYAIMNKEPEPAQQINHALWLVITKSLDKSPPLRYASASDMLKALETARHASSGTVLDAGNPYGLTPPPLSQNNPFISQQPYPGNYQTGPSSPAQYPYSQPYNPYQQTGGAFQQGPPQPTLGPVISQNTYDPYQQYQPYQQPQQTYLPGPGAPQLPPYYPPPPRRPLLTPEQAAATKRGALLAVTVALIFLAVVVVLLYYSNAFQPGNTQNGVAPNANYGQNSNSVGQPIEGSIPEFPPGDPSDEEAAKNLEDQASRETDIDAHMKDLEDAATKYESAGSAYIHLGDSSSQQRCYDEAARARLAMAKLCDTTNKALARKVLYTARSEVTPDSELSQEIEDEINKLVNA